MKRFLATAIVAASAVFAGASAQAASHTTFLTGNDGLANSHSYTTADGVNITATATSKGIVTTKKALVGEYSKGLGVTSYKGDDHQVDGFLRDETLWLSFDKDFVLKGILFSYVDSNDDATISVNMKSGNVDLGDHYIGKGLAFLDLSKFDLTTTKIGITATGNYDDFKVKAVKGHAVPTPSAAIAGLAGIIGVVARRRRQAEAA